MLAAIRIRGLVNVPRKIKDTLYLLRLRRKHVLVLLDETKQVLGMLEKVKSRVAWGKINKETLELLLEKRARKKGNKRLSKEEVTYVVKTLEEADKAKEVSKALKRLNKELDLKPFFRLAPPRKGFKKSIKLPWPQGMLGNQGEAINELIARMC